MATHRITVTIPDYLHRQMIAVIPDRQVSSFVAMAVEERLATYDSPTKHEAIDAFINLHKTIPTEKRLPHTKIVEAIKKGRT